MKTIIKILFLVLLALKGTLVHAHDEDVFVMGMIRPETQLFGKWQRMVYSEAFARLGIELRYRQLPPGRATEYADDGKIDGEPARPSKYNAKHPNMLRVDEPVFMVNFTAFSTQEFESEIASWEDLAAFKGKFIEHRRGIHICEINLPKYVPETNLSSVSTTAQAMQKLKAGRTDIYVDEETGVLTLLSTPGFSSSGIHIAGVVDSFPAYMYVHKSRADMLDDLATVIKEMKSEGLVAAYRKQLDIEFRVVSSPIVPEDTPEQRVAEQQ